MRELITFLLCSFLVNISSGKSADLPILIDKTVTPPVLIKKVEPAIPEAIRGKVMKGGVIILEAVITRKGDVTNVRVLRSVEPLLEKEAIKAVKQWKYKPALKNGKPVSVYFTVTSIIHVR